MDSSTCVVNREMDINTDLILDSVKTISKKRGDLVFLLRSLSQIKNDPVVAMKIPPEDGKLIFNSGYSTIHN